jgi:hypothetical protein
MAAYALRWELNFNGHNKDDMQAGDVSVIKRGPDRKIMHPQYDPNAAIIAPYNFDVGLYYFEDPIVDIPTIGLDLNGTYTEDGQSMTVAGWGTTTEAAWIPSKTPNQVELTVTPCARAGYPARQDLFCAESSAPRGGGPCLADAGGPGFVQVADGEYVQTGVISSWDVSGCATPSAYASINHYKDFICGNVPELC